MNLGDLSREEVKVSGRPGLWLPSWQSQQGHQAQNQPLTPRGLPRSELRNDCRIMYKSLFLILTIFMCFAEK